MIDLWNRYEDLFVQLRLHLIVLNILQICVTAALWRAGNTRLNFVQPGSDPVGTHAGLLRQPGLLR